LQADAADCTILGKYGAYNREGTAAETLLLKSQTIELRRLPIFLTAVTTEQWYDFIFVLGFCAFAMPVPFAL
jgi:hypothetical protein